MATTSWRVRTVRTPFSGTDAVTHRRCGLTGTFHGAGGGLARKLATVRPTLATASIVGPGEVEGRDYFFVDKPKFERMVEQGDGHVAGALSGAEPGLGLAEGLGAVDRAGDIEDDAASAGAECGAERTGAGVVEVGDVDDGGTAGGVGGAIGRETAGSAP